MISAGAFHSIFPGMTLSQRQGVGDQAPAGYSFLRVGSPSPGTSQLVRVGANGSAPRILIKVA